MNKSQTVAIIKSIQVNFPNSFIFYIKNGTLFWKYCIPPNQSPEKLIKEYQGQSSYIKADKDLFLIKLYISGVENLMRTTVLSIESLDNFNSLNLACQPFPELVYGAFRLTFQKCDFVDLEL